MQNREGVPRSDLETVISVWISKCRVLIGQELVDIHQRIIRTPEVRRIPIHYSTGTKRTTVPGSNCSRFFVHFSKCCIWCCVDFHTGHAQIRR